ncbi:MAG: hypothetical protein ACI35S_03385 [Anaeroplasma sp.]
MEFIELTNNFKTKIILCTVGASIYDIKTADSKGKIGSILITPKNKNEFATTTSYLGKTIGRTGGRISDSKFILNNETYYIPSNDPNGLHGGIDGLSYKEFTYKLDEDFDSYICDFYYFSPDMESGYPGNLSLHVIYKLYKHENKLEINYRGKSDKDTLLNLSNHAYFNLNAESGNNILEHTLYINSSKMEEISNSLPKGIVDCNKKYSFKIAHKIKDFIFDDEIINNTNGYDHPYIFDNQSNNQIILYDEASNKKLIVNTTYPAVVVYTSNYPEDLIMNNNRKWKMYDSICLECMYLPNSINSKFIDKKKDILKKDLLYNETITFIFN